jgi:hypothetical protein
VVQVIVDHRARVVRAMAAVTPLVLCKILPPLHLLDDANSVDVDAAVALRLAAVLVDHVMGVAVHQ